MKHFIMVLTVLAYGAAEPVFAQDNDDDTNKPSLEVGAYPNVISASEAVSSMAVALYTASTKARNAGEQFDPAYSNTSLLTVHRPRF